MLEPRKQHIKIEFTTQLRQLISEWVARNAHKDSLITITKCELSEYGGRVTVFVSVFPEHKLTGALSFLTRNGKEIADHITNKLPHRRKPYLLFSPDVAFSIQDTNNNG